MLVLTIVLAPLAIAPAAIRTKMVQNPTTILEMGPTTAAKVPALALIELHPEVYMNSLLCFFTVLFCSPAFAGSFTDFNLPIMNGDPGQTYSTLNYKPLLVEFYFNGCSSCQANADNVKEMSNQFNNETTNVLEFSYDCRQSDYDSWIRRHAPTSFVINGCQSPIFDELNVTAFPTTVIFDSNHTEVARYVGVWSTRTKAAIKLKMQELSQ